jgi:hypothetical protein
MEEQDRLMNHRGETPSGWAHAPPKNKNGGRLRVRAEACRGPGFRPSLTSHVAVAGDGHAPGDFACPHSLTRLSRRHKRLAWTMYAHEFNDNLVWNDLTATGSGWVRGILDYDGAASL